ncbi:hypothetical protein MIR68_008802 [Amoeboaphelidium protococcarum]|nr:hypothetical protein MIR68_008802 [Amoeboaphelidium protococcarum]
MGLSRSDFATEEDYKKAKKAAKLLKKEKESGVESSGEKSKKRSASEAIDVATDKIQEVKKVKTSVAAADKDIKSEPTVIKVDTEKQDDSELDVTKFNISVGTRQKLLDRGISKLFPIQASTFNHIFDGKDLLGRARTGSGKTLAFALPVIERLKQGGSDGCKYPSVLVMCPTRELAKQVALEFQTVSGNLKVLTVYGGVPYFEQERGLRDGIDVIVGTPGRLLDHLERRNLKLSNIKFVIMDEADQMLDIGFKDSMEKILDSVKEAKSGQNAKFQVLLFSATLPDWVQNVTRQYLDQKNMITIDLVGNSKVKTNEDIKHLAIQCSWQQRAAILPDVIRVYGGGSKGRTIIFTETKSEANELALGSSSQGQDDKREIGDLDAQVLHGDIAQKQREITLQGFRDGKFRVLVATDVAARGLDIPSVELIIQTQPPKDVDTFVHRSGRTGRAGAKGINICFYKPNEEWAIKNCEKKTGIKFKRIGAPQVEDLLKASISDAIQSIDSVSSEVLPMFLPVAEQLMDGSSPYGTLDSVNVDTKEEQVVQLLARALAVLTNTLNPPTQRSLLTCTAGMTTLCMKLPNAIRSPGYVRAILERNYPDIGRDEWKGFRMLADSSGCVFDIDSKKVDSIVKQWKLNASQSNAELSVVREMPELQERDSFGGGNGGSQQRSYGGGQRNSYGGSNKGGNPYQQRSNYNNGGGNRSSYGSNRSYGGSKKY